MTIPFERTQSVLRARDLLMDLAAVHEDIDLEALRGRARTLLRHFPEPVHFQLSAALAPGIWADPDAKWYE
jgi:hypothetical protein